MKDCFDVMWCGRARSGLIWHGLDRFGMVRHGLVRFGKDLSYRYKYYLDNMVRHGGVRWAKVRFGVV